MNKINKTTNNTKFSWFKNSKGKKKKTDSTTFIYKYLNI